MLATDRFALRRQIAAGLLLGLAGAGIALTDGLVPKITLTFAFMAIPGAFWLLLNPNLWLYSFFVIAWLSPPLPLRLGDSGPHVAIPCAAVGLFIGLLRGSAWRFRADSLSISICLLLSVMLASSALSAVYSGAVVAAGSMARSLLFGIAVYLFFYIRHGPFRRAGQDARTFIRLLFGVAAASATYAVVDFYFQFPAPGGYEAQFLWLSSGTFRRAQGFFYEASTLGNMCVFFLDMIAAAVFCTRSATPQIKRWILLCGAIPLLGALVLSYSRASLLSLFAGLVALALLQRKRVSPRRLWVSLGAVGLAAGAFLVQVLPSFAEAYWIRLSNTFEFFRESPNAILSGRLYTWEALVEFLISNPGHAIVGIGYKSLPYADLTGAPIIADNTYLSSLVETGVFGLAVLLAFNLAVLKSSYRSSSSTDPTRAFFGTWMFTFWVGQVIQMFSADLLTYWRVLPAYFCVLALASGSDDQLSTE